ncbi:hypothetical protein [Desulfatitalea tepidiphila]|uniref:hypothetical protein n=1 Tax=Desulfatitalea tepidiphila TaxID=1185843 RepID=UPI0006B623CF|nr:hypothetical protein [Desulfatitalea tepidiphila]
MKANDPMSLHEPYQNGKIILDALEGVVRNLSMINASLEILLSTDPPEFVKPDLIRAYEAERHASQIARNLTIFCHKTF